MEGAWFAFEGMGLGSHRRGRAVGGVAAALALVVLVEAPAAAARSPRKRQVCGAPITKSFRLDNPLNCAGTDGLVVAADNITLDLAGNAIFGDGTPGTRGIVNQGHDGVVIKKGVIGGFETGVRIEMAKRNKIKRLVLGDNDVWDVRLEGVRTSEIVANTFTGPSSDGLSMDSAKRNVIERNHILGKDDGIVLGNGSNRNVVTRNEILGGSGSGVSVFDSHRNAIVQNDSRAHLGAGIFLSSGASGNAVKNNDTIANGTDGILVSSSPSDSSSPGNAVVRNNSTGNADAGIDLINTSTGNRVEGNDASANGHTGIRAAVATAGNVLKENVTNENGENGIASFTDDVAIRKNKARFNGFVNGIDNGGGLGIFTIGGASGAGNRAAGNDDTSECNQPGLCVAPTPPVPTVPLTGCGMVNSEVVLRNPLDCTGDGLVVAANGLALDLGRHRVSAGTALNDTAILNSAGFEDLTVRGGVVAHADEAISTSGAENNVFEDVLITDMVRNGHVHTNATGLVVSGGLVSQVASFNGVAISGGHTNSVEGTQVVAVGDNGVSVSSSTGAAIRDSRVATTGLAGIALVTADTSVLARNTVAGTTENGIVLNGSGDNLLSRNRVRAAGTSGIRLDGAVGSPDNTLKSNRATANRHNGVLLLHASTTGTVLRANDLSRNVLSGLQVAPGPTGAEIVKNVMNANGVNGIQVDAPGGALVVRRNVANRNGFVSDVSGDDVGLGVLAPGGTPGCGNIGKRNDDPEQVEPSELKLAC